MATKQFSPLSPSFDSTHWSLLVVCGPESAWPCGYGNCIHEIFSDTGLLVSVYVPEMVPVQEKFQKIKDRKYQ